MSEGTQPALAATDPKDQLEQDIKSALLTGSPFLPAAQSIFEIAEGPDSGPASLTVALDVGLEDEVNKIASLVAGSPVATAIPTQSSFLGQVFKSLRLESVSYSALRTSKSEKPWLSSLGCEISVWTPAQGGGRPTRGATLQVAEKLAITLDALDVLVVMPGHPGQTLYAKALGTLEIEPAAVAAVGGPGARAPKTLDVSLDFPDLELSITEPGGETISIADLLGIFNISVKGDFASLSLEDLQFIVGLSNKSVSFASDVVYVPTSTAPSSPGGTALVTTNAKSDGASDLIPFPLIDGVLALDRMSFAFDWGQGSYSAAVVGLLEFTVPSITKGRGLLLTADARKSDAVWDFSGAIDVGGTLTVWNETTAESLTVELIAKHLLNLSASKISLIPSELRQLGLEALGVEYKVDEDAGPGSSYAFHGVFDGDWGVDGLDLHSAVEIDLRQADGTRTDKVFALFDLDGFKLSLGYDFVQQEVQAEVAIGSVDVVGTYDHHKQSASLTFKDDLAIGDGVAWFVASLTGNPGFEFSEPWNQILDEVEIKSGSTLEVSWGATKSVKVTLPAGGKPHFGIEVKSVTIQYQRKQGESEGALSFSLEGTFPSLLESGGNPASGKSTISWDPSQPGTEPSVPGLGASYFDVGLVAAGQRIAFPVPAPDRVEDAISTLTSVLSPDGDQETLFPAKLEFQGDSGWLIGAKMTFLGQVVTEIIFNDPNMYGLMIRVDAAPGKAPSDEKLDLFVGLYFEVLYRKVTDSIGEYFVALTLPKQFRTLDLGSVVVYMPSFSLAIYTNGNFKIDLGFPYHADFSKSAGVTYLVFTGQGGFYFGYLNGDTASGLPTITNPGTFNPVIEFGIGIAVGIMREFNEGPLSAQLKAMMEFIIQGTYAKFSLQNPVAGQNSDVYYKVSGMVRFVGELTGSVDLAIITADLLVKLVATATLSIEHYVKTYARFSVSVSVSLTVKIHLGLFTIHVHVHFGAEVHTSFSFGSDSTGLWAQTPALEERRVLAVTDGTGATVMGWQPIRKDTAGEFCGLSGYLVPQLTKGKIDGEADAPVWVAMLYLNNPQEPPAAGDAPQIDYEDPAPAFTDFAEGVLRWVLNAYGNDDPGTTVSEGTVDEKPIDETTVAAIQEYLGSTPEPFSIHHVHSFTENYYKLQLQAPKQVSNGSQYGFAYFPMLPEFDIEYTQGGSGPTRGRSITLSPAYFDRLDDTSVDGALRSRRRNSVSGTHSSTLDATDGSSLRDKVVVDYFKLVARFGVQCAADYLKTLGNGGGQGDGDVTGASSPPTIGDVVENADLADAAGFATRNLLHGTRALPPTEGAPAPHEDAPAPPPAAETEPFYELTGQRFPVVGTTDTSATLTLSLAENADDYWNVVGPEPPQMHGSIQLVEIESGDAQSLLRSPAGIHSGLDLELAIEPTAGELPIAHSEARRFGISLGTPWAIGGDKTPTTLWQLPPTLQSAFAKADGASTFELYVGKEQDDGSIPSTDPTPVAADDLSWATTVRVTVRRISTPGTTGAKGSQPGDLASTYELARVDAAGIHRLQQVLAATAALDGATVHIAYGLANDLGHVEQFESAEAADLTMVLLRSNLSTESRPQNTSAVLLSLLETAPPPDVTGFLTNLWTGGITNSGGYYLYYDVKGAGLPEELFGQGGEAELTVVIRYDSATVASKPLGYMDAVVTANVSVAAGDVLYSSSSDITHTVATIEAGHVGVQVTRDAPPDPAASPRSDNGGEQYGPSLEYLFNLLTCYVSAIGTTAIAAPPKTTGVGPVDPEDGPTAAGGVWTYRQVYPLLPPYRVAGAATLAAPPAPSPPPPPDQNPYTPVGQPVSFYASWTDLFGNEITTPGVGLDSIDALYFDPVPSLAGLPNLSFAYRFKAGGTEGANLEVDFHFNTNPYTDVVARMEAAIACLKANGVGHTGSPPTTVAGWVAAAEAHLGTDEGRASDRSAVTDDCPQHPISTSLQTLVNTPQSIANDAEKYALFYYQLDVEAVAGTDKGVTGYVTSSILDAIQATPGDSPPGLEFETTLLKHNAYTVYGYLMGLIPSVIGTEAPTEPALTPLKLTEGFAAADVKDDLIYLLGLSIMLRRDGCIHAPFDNQPDGGVSDVVETVTPIPPRPDQTTTAAPSDHALAAEDFDTSKGPLTYRHFAEDFKHAFAAKSMVIASGVAWQGNGPARDAQLWVVRYGANGIQFKGRTPRYFAAPPLSNTLLAQNPVKYAEYDPATGGLTKPGAVSESPRVCRRLHQLRGWSHEKERTVLPRGTGASRSDGFRARA